MKTQLLFRTALLPVSFRKTNVRTAANIGGCCTTMIIYSNKFSVFWLKQLFFNSVGALIFCSTNSPISLQLQEGRQSIFQLIFSPFQHFHHICIHFRGFEVQQLFKIITGGSHEHAFIRHCYASGVDPAHRKEVYQCAQYGFNCLVLK